MRFYAIEKLAFAIVVFMGLAIVGYKLNKDAMAANEAVNGWPRVIGNPALRFK